MKEIKGTPKNLKSLLQNAKYTVNYYQREYRWQRRQIEELTDDLTTEFLRNYKPGHKRDDVTDYDIYFMGSIILAGRENELIDGQQRLSSLTLLLMYLRNRLIKLKEHHPTVELMIYSQVRGKDSFNIDVPERQACMTAIFKDDLDNFDTTDAIESVKNLCDAYGIIEDNFPSNITDADDMLLIFSDWLIEKVFFIEIVAQEESDASKIFITMNDRGLSLTPTEMLKSYLLSEIKSGNTREKLNRGWKNKIEALKRNDVNGDEVFIKAWLRAQYADIQFVRDENTQSSRQMTLEGFGEETFEEKFKEDFSDFSQISGEFHKWLHDNHSRLGLNKATDWERFIEEFFYFVDVYLKIRKAERTFDAATKYVYCNAQINVTLQPMFLMAPICFKDDSAAVMQKINLAARFIDLWINSRITCGKSVEYKYIQDYVFRIAKDIRRCSIKELKSKLKSHFDVLNYSNFTAQDLRLNKKNKRYVKNILARITSFIEEQTGIPSHYVEYMDTTADDPFEIEHIICNDFERFKHDFVKEYLLGNKIFDKDDFDDWRNKIGALLLLRKSINASLNDSDYPQKLVKYCSADGNIYAASLGKQTYRNNPRLKQFIKANRLSFEPFGKFGKAEIQKRIRLVVELMNLIWNTEEFQ